MRAAPAVVIAVAIAAAAVGCSSGPTMPAPPTLTIYDSGTPGLSLPTLVQEVKPNYTADAIANRIQGIVVMTAVVLPDGTVGDVSVIRSLDTTFGLDAQAVLALRQWRFNPGLKDGVAVAVRVSVEMTFTLR